MHRTVSIPLLLICLLLGLAAKGNTMSTVPPKSPSPAVEIPDPAQRFSRILLACPTDVPDSDALCQALITALQQRAPKQPIQRSRSTPAAGELAITLHISRSDKFALEGFLTWQTKTGSQKKGPPVTLGADDTSIAPHMFPSFASGLLQLSKLPID